ncbi:unnamed protein product [Bemisia tabaci]|uniref:Uncharacterized protein n=1 Tax=Bemisia tabaci TaxID=7038 RepID=A0A9P0A533_BEMTA|nr:unnamed protein product [Bemisia tabaci]
MIKSLSSLKRLTPLNIHDSIFFKKTPDDHWVPGTIIGKCKEPDSYLIQSTNGKVYRRTRYHIKAHNKNVHFSFDNLNNCKSSVQQPTLSADHQQVEHKFTSPIVATPKPKNSAKASNSSGQYSSGSSSPVDLTNSDSENEYGTPQEVPTPHIFKPRGRGRGLNLTPRDLSNRQIKRPARYND